MKKIEFRYNSSVWGALKEEINIINFENKTYCFIENGAIKKYYQLTEEILAGVEKIFAPIYVDFPKSISVFDAPTWTLTIDDKTCTRIAVDDSTYDNLTMVFKIFKDN